MDCELRGDVPAAPIAVRDAFSGQLRTELVPLHPTVFGRPYRPPRFWVAGGHAATDPSGAALDALSGGQHGMRDLRDDIEQWALVSLFATERPRWFYMYPLPRLALRYGCYPGWTTLPVRLERDNGPPLVTRSDLLLEPRMQCHAVPDEVDRVVRWTGHLRAAARERELSAAEVLKMITDTGVRAGMPRPEAEAVLARMRPADH